MNRLAHRLERASRWPGTIRRHSGARRRREPGIHNPRRWLWIPGSLATLGPRNDDGEFGASRPRCAIARAIALASLWALAFGPVAAQQSPEAAAFPNRSIKIVVPFP